MYQPRHLNVNWMPYYVGPPLPGSPGYYLSPQCRLPTPSKVFRVCSPGGPRMAHPSKPAALIPALMTMHPGTHHAPVIGLSPMVERPSPLYPRDMQACTTRIPALSNRDGSPKIVTGNNSNRKEMVNRIPEAASTAPMYPRDHQQPCTPRNSASASGDGNHASREETVNRISDRRPISPEVVDLALEGDSRNPAVCRKRSASPSETGRKLKRQREVAQSADKTPRNSSEMHLITPQKIKASSQLKFHEEDKFRVQELSSSIELLYSRHMQREDLLKQKMALRDALQNIINSIYPCCGLYMVGSSMTGLAASSSDLDLCLVLSQTEIDQQTEAIVYLREVLNLLKFNNFIKKCQLILAKVPILKFLDTVSGVEVDLNVNNIVGIRNTQLLNNYSRMDERVKPLCLVVKLWAKVQDINDPFNKTLSSYSLILMVIHYLQVGCDPPVLPCLHKLMPGHFSSTSDIRGLSLKLDLPQFDARNCQSLGELLLGFFHYFGYLFKFQDEVISVRTGATLPKGVAMKCRSPKNKPGQWNYICIEEPFDRTNTARAVFDKLTFDRIKKTFAVSMDTLKETLDLDSVLCTELVS